MKHSFLRLLFLCGSAGILVAQTAPVIVEAESGTLGAEVSSVTEGGTQFIRSATDGSGQNPAAAARVASYSVVFPQAGTYDLYVRVRVGAGGFNDDSFYYANGFGSKVAAADADWIMANGLAAAGYSTGTDVVGGSGTAGNNVWKWLKLSAFDGGETPISFTVAAGALTQTFQIGMRENGLDIDKFAFGHSGISYTVTNLDNGQSGAGTPPPAPYTPGGPPLATGLNKFLGSIYSTSQRTNMTAYFNQITPENAGKWGSVEAVRDVMNWTELDAAYELAKSNNFPFRFHVLLWGNQQPRWIATLPPAEQLEEIEEWFRAVAERYPAIDYLEVVNEPISDAPDGIDSSNPAEDGNYLAALGGTGATGWDWVRSAFRLARLHFPASTKLMLNEYSITNDASRMQRYVGMVNILKAEDLIDAVGIQGHAFSTRNIPASTATANLNLLAATGLPIMVTEMDIDGSTDDIQLTEYQRVFPTFWEHPSVIGITLWGYRPGLWRNAQGAYLALENGAERSALQWLKSYVLGNRAALGGLPRSDSAAAGGSVTLSVAANGSPALQWQRNGASLPGQTGSTLALTNVQPANAGLYSVSANNGAAVSSTTIVGVTSSSKVIGEGSEVLENQPHPNTNVYDQVLLEGTAATITADSTLNQVTRMSFIDLDDDIVQVEFAGPGTLSIYLDGSSGPAAPTRYNQSNVSYMKGHASIVITGANEFTNVSVFTVGRATAFDRTGQYNILKSPNTTDNNPVNNGSPLFVGHQNTTYDGIADIAFIAISSTNGRFGGVRTANANYFADRGFTGVYAPGVAFTGPVNIGDIIASGSAKPVIVLGSAATTQITGGDLLQSNGEPVEVSGISLLRFVDGSDSHGHLLTAQSNHAVLRQNGRDVTADLVANPAP